MRQARYRFLLLPLLLVLASVAAFAQANSTVTGTVTDQTGAVVPGAKITLTDPATGTTKTTVSSSSGLYEFAGLNAANYNLKVSAKGFETYTQTGVVVNISQTFRVDAKLTVGAETTDITVNADALTVQSDSNVVSNLINEEQITDLPTNGRNVIGLAALGLGVSGNLPDTQNPFSVNANYAISFNGLSQAHNIWLVDGGEAYDRGSGGKMSVMPSQDALGEFQVLSSNYPPDYGIASGGTVTMSIKSGTQKFHASAWEFDRNDALDAHNWFDTNQQSGAVSPKAELRYNIFGANVGGPVYIPGVYNTSKKKTFFFVNEEWRKEVNGAPTSPINTVPAADLVTTSNVGSGLNYVLPAYGSATALIVPTVSANSRVGQAIAAYNTANSATPSAQLIAGHAFPNNFLPATLLDSNALLFNTTGNLPAATSSADTYIPQGGHLPINVREDLFRIDHTINDKWTLFGHFIHDANDTVQATPEWQGDNFTTIGTNFSNPSYSSVIKLTGSLTPTVLLEAAFNYDGNKIAIVPVAAEGGNFVKPSGWNTGTYFAAANDVGNRLPDITWTTIPNGSNASEWGPGNDPWTNGAEDYNEIGSISVTEGKHQLKFGGEYNRYTKNQVIGKDSEGDYTFGDKWANGAPVGPLTGDSYADFLLGLATNFSQSNANPTNHYVNNSISVYAQDNWHVNSRLSLQYGFRFDALPHVWERNNLVSNFNPSLYQSALKPTWDPSGSGAFAAGSPGLFTNSIGTFYLNGIEIAGQNGVPRGIARQDYKTFMPRVGFSYDLFGNGKTVLRGGFGTFYERIQGNDIYDAAGSAPLISTPSANKVEFSNPSANWQSGTAASTPTFVQGYNSLNNYYPNPGVAQYSLGVQHQIVPSLILVTQYVGNLAWHQNTWVPINNFPLSTPLATRAAYVGGTLSTVDTLNAAKYPGFGQIRLQSNPLTGSYNSFQIGLRQQNKHGLSYEVDYTYAHQIDDQQTSTDVDNNNPSYNPWNLKYDKGSGTLDRRQVLNTNYEYHLPFFNHAAGLERTALGGWEISGTFISETGLPWLGNGSPKNDYGDTVGLGGDYSIRPDQVGKVHYVKGIATYRDSNNVAHRGYQMFTNGKSSAGGNTAFAAPTPGWLGGANLGFGNSGKDAIVGPGRTNFSTALGKSFAFGEKAHFDFRAEAFNTFNHTQFNTLSDGNANNTDFGFASYTQDPREFEIGLKFVY